MSDGSSTLQTELDTFIKALDNALSAGQGSVVIHTNPRGGIDVIRSEKTTDDVYIATSIQYSLHFLDQHGRCAAKSHWIPSHIGIPGNNIADATAKAATRFGRVALPLAFTITQIKGVTIKKA